MFSLDGVAFSSVPSFQEKTRWCSGFPPHVPMLGGRANRPIFQSLRPILPLDFARFAVTRFRKIITSMHRTTGRDWTFFTLGAPLSRSLAAWALLCFPLLRNQQQQQKKRITMIHERGPEIASRVLLIVHVVTGTFFCYTGRRNEGDWPGLVHKLHSAQE